MNLLSSMWATFGIVLGVVAVLAIIFSVLIVVVSKVCEVKEDERIIKTSELLANANCGGCGFAGCADFAKAVVEGRADISMCGPTSNNNKQKIAEMLGVPFSAGEEAYAIVHCAGGNNAVDKYEYLGNEGCVAENSFMGGRKSCPNGCLGEGTCASCCPYGAIAIVNGVAYTDKSICEACGVCIKKCPKKLIKLVPKSAKVYVGCSTTCKGKESMSVCKHSCIACGLCAKNCPQGAITMINNIPVIDYQKCNGCKTCVVKCPRKCIKELI